MSDGFTTLSRPSKNVVLKRYYEWLCDIIHVNQHDKSYWLLIKDLYRKPFYWTVPNDDNRAYEGKNLREKFCDEQRIEYIYDYFDSTPSLLEVIIGSAYRCEEMMIDQDDNMGMNFWFWKMLRNVGLEKFTDDNYHDLNGELIIDDILTKIIDRTYHRNGRGGLFPLKNYKKDQRKVELWYQMNSYLVENYYVENELL